MMETLHFSFETQVFCEEELTPSQRELIKVAREATAASYAPYSHFCVGAAARLLSGVIIKGSNQENAAYPSGLCAERVALFSAGSQRPDDPVVEMALVARYNNEFTPEPITPCGACRQVMTETEQRNNTSLRLFLVGQSSVLVVERASFLMPLSFDAIKK